MRNYLIKLLGGVTREEYNINETFWKTFLRDSDVDRIRAVEEKELTQKKLDDAKEHGRSICDSLQGQLAKANEQILAYEHEKAEFEKLSVYMSDVTGCTPENMEAYLKAMEKHITKPKAKKGKVSKKDIRQVAKNIPGHVLTEDGHFYAVKKGKK